MNSLHKGAKWQFRIGGYAIFGFFGVFFEIGFFIIFGLVIGSSNSVVLILLMFLLLVISYFLFVIGLSEIYAQMSYNRWFYEFTDEGIRLERGIIWKKYSNIPYERVQNVDIYRGILARMFGFSSIMIQTAGFSGISGAEGSIPAVEMKKAEEIRTFIMKKLKSKKR